MKILKLTGGARVGMANASFPFATLKVTKDCLEINASIVGNLVFKATDIISIEPYTTLPLVGQGIKINHNVSTYKERVIFWTFKDPKSVIDQIYKTGFFNQTSETVTAIDRSIRASQAQGGFPVKRSVAIVAIVLWNLLFLSDIIPFVLKGGEGVFIGSGVLIALGLLFFSAVLLLISHDFRRLVLKEGRTLEDIKKFAILLAFVSGFMWFNFSLAAKFF